MYQEALEIDPKNAQRLPREWRGDFSRRRVSAAKAKEAADKALELDSERFIEADELKARIALGG